ncbi:MAG: hypothetical protein J5496_07765 [Lachnospiraceae bacterium]|nr:hypothetical protein [Lachnospiraceae bacterium]
MKPITNKALFYFLNFTWGLPLNIGGLLVCLIMLLTGHKPHRWGPCIYFNAGRHWGGAEWGVFFVTDKEDSIHVKNHEMGHAMQNCYFGPLMPFLICIPSVIRYWSRRFQEKTKHPPRKGYDAIWFEGSATRLGMRYWKALAETKRA